MFRAAMCPSSGELLYHCGTWFMSLCVDERLVCKLGWNSVHPNRHTRRSSTQIYINQMLHWYNNYPDYGHMAVRNVYRIEINIHEKLCVKLVIYKDHWLCFLGFTGIFSSRHTPWCRSFVNVWQLSGRHGVRISLWVQEIISEMSRPALGPTQPPVQWTLWFFIGSKTAGAWEWPLQIVPRWMSGAMPHSACVASFLGEAKRLAWQEIRSFYVSRS